MPAPYLLDTNAYALLLRRPKPESCVNLEGKIQTGADLTFFLPQMVSIEIHSVLGKYRRGGNKEQHEQCDRSVLSEHGNVRCAHTCVFPAQVRLKDKVFRDLQKLLRDIEEQRGTIKATVLPVGAAQFAIAKQLVVTYCDRFAFGSHDAMITASVLNAKTTQGLTLTVITEDKGLKALCAAVSIPTYDPSLDESRAVT